MRKVLQYIFELRRKILSRKRVLFFRFMGAKIGCNVKIWGPVEVTGKFSNISIGDNCVVNTGVFLAARDKIIIGNDVTVSSHTKIITGKLDLSDGRRSHKSAQIEIQKNCWIATSCILLAGSLIEENSIISAGLIINTHIPRNSFVKSAHEILENKYAG